MPNLADSPKPLSPRFAAAVFFALFALLCLLFAKYILLSFKDNIPFPVGYMIFSVIFTGAIAGSIFGNKLAKSRSAWSIFFIGCALALLEIFQISLSIYLRAYLLEPVFFAQLKDWQAYFVVFGLVFSSVLLMLGIWLIPLTGLAALFFNRKFLPGLLAADAEQRQNSPKK